jgi:hypothetical protein
MEAKDVSIKSPIFWAAPECAIFLSLDEAEGSIEPPDVREAPLYDSTGRELAAIPDEERYRVRIVAAEDEAQHQAELADEIRAQFRNPHPHAWVVRSGILDELGITEEWLASASLHDLVERAVAVEVAFRNRPTRLRRLRTLLRLNW